MKNKFIFLDIDGTIFKRRIGVTEEVRTSIIKARQNGHKVFICTGRSKCEIPEEVLQLEFDGFICSSGSHIEINNENIFFSSFNNEDILNISEDVSKLGIGIILKGLDIMLYNDTCVNILPSILSESALKEQELKTKISYHINEYNKENHKVLLITVFAYDRNDFKEIINKYKNDFDIIFYDSFKVKDQDVYTIDIMQKKISKASGIEKVLEYFGGNQKDTICFGDSRNDLEMVQFCEIGVCMENGSDELKSVADRVCPPVKESGVAQEFKNLSLI